MDKPSPVTTTPYYQKIKELIDQIKAQEILPRLSRNCIAASDLVQNLLAQHGIQSRIIEVEATATKFYPDGKSEFMFIGYDNLKFPGQLDSHLVVITETAIPILIDLSLQYVLAHTSQEYILREANSSDMFFADYTIDDIRLSYQVKKNIKWPQVHQRNILDRINEENKTRQTLHLLKIWTIVGIGMSVFNMMANTILIILKMLWK